MAKSMKPGGGGRFDAMSKKVGSDALSAWIGRKKYGKKKMAKWSAQGQKRAAKSKKKGVFKRSAFQKIKMGLKH